jgi:hypothetical protein
MMQRWKTHVHHAKSSKGGRWHFPNAIRKYGKDAFSHEVLEVCYDLEVANLAEECWIEFYDTRNPEKGFNLAKGGQHVPHLIRKNPWDDPEFRAARTNESRARAADPAFVAARAAESRSRASDPEFRSKISAGVRNKWEDPQYRSDRIADKLANWQDPIYREKMSIASRSVMADPAVRAKCAPKAHFNTSKTHCKNGHSFSQENTRFWEGRRICRVCSRFNLQKSRAKHG